LQSENINLATAYVWLKTISRALNSQKGPNSSETLYQEYTGANNENKLKGIHLKLHGPVMNKDAF